MNDPNMNDLCTLFEKNSLNKSNIISERFQEVVQTGRWINHHLENYNQLTREDHETLLDYIYNLFILYRKEFVDGNENYSFYETPKLKNRAKFIHHSIRYHLSIDPHIRSLEPHRYSIKTMLTLSKGVFVQLYYLVRSDLDPYPGSMDIYDYPKPVSFFEHDDLE